VNDQQAKGDAMNSLDYLLLAWLGISALLGFYRGFLAVLGGLASSLIALFIAIIYRNDLALYLEKEFNLQTILAQGIADKLPQLALGGSPINNFLPALKTLPIVQAQLAGLAQMILVAVSFLLLYIIISKGLRLVWKILEAPFRQGVLGGINRLAGLLLLAGKDLLIMAVLLGISYPLIKSGAGMGIKGFVNASSFIDKSQVAPYLMAVFANLEKLLGLGV
jgi:uncharacterized membrane protein required for colicin V production